MRPLLDADAKIDAAVNIRVVWVGCQNAMGRLHRAAERVDEAIRCYDDILALDGRGGEALDPGMLMQAWSDRGECLYEAGRHAEALASLLRAEALAEKDDGAKEILAKVRGTIAAVKAAAPSLSGMGTQG